jgi:hypothetical protein
MAAGISLALTFTLSCSGDGGGDGGDDSSSSVTPSSSSFYSNALLLNFTSDMDTQGELRWMNTTDTALASGSLSFDQDSKVFTHGGKIFVLERPLDANFVSNGTLNCLTPPLNSSSSRVSQSLAAGSNPYDIAFMGDYGYIAQYGLNYLQVFNWTNCTLTDTIHLPDVLNTLGLSSSSGASANAVSINAKGDTLLVVMQIWNPYPSTALQGALVRISATTKQQIGATIRLIYYNPQSSVLKGDSLYIASAYDLYNGIISAKSGIEYLNGLTATSTTNLVDGNALGVNVGPTSMVLGNGELWTIVYHKWPTYQNPQATVKSVSLSGTVSGNVPDVNSATCLVYDNVENNLFIGNGTVYGTTTASLMRYYLSDTDTIGNSRYPDDNALPPYSLAIVRW